MLLFGRSVRCNLPHNCVQGLDQVAGVLVSVVLGKYVQHLSITKNPRSERSLKLTPYLMRIRRYNLVVTFGAKVCNARMRH